MTYPEMNAQIVGLLRLLPSDDNAMLLYAAERIEEMQTALQEIVELSGVGYIQNMDNERVHEIAVSALALNKKP